VCVGGGGGGGGREKKKKTFSSEEKIFSLRGWGLLLEHRGAAGLRRLGGGQKPLEFDRTRLSQGSKVSANVRPGGN